MSTIAVLLLVLFWIGLQAQPFDGDAVGYWHHLRMADWYTGVWNVTPAWVYPPPLGIVLQPLVALPLPLFYAVWTGLLTVALAWLVGPLWAVLLLLPPEPFRHEITAGNVQLLMAAALVMRPAAWAILPLTKITPGVVLLWYAMRREWRSLGIALGVTCVMLAGSLLIAPDQWLSWIERMAASRDSPPIGLPVAVIFRLPLAAALVIFAAWHGWRWLLPLAVWLALPNLHLMGLSLLAALPRAMNPEAEVVLAGEGGASQPQTTQAG